MSAAVEINVQEKNRNGKGSAREARRQGMIPCVVYGGNNKNPRSYAIDSAAIKMQLRKDVLFTSTYDLVLDGKKTEHVLARDLQVDPVTDDLLHLDFLRITDNTRLSVPVPIHMENEENCPGIKMGGVLQIIRTTADLSCPASAIPSSISIDLSQFNMGDTIRISNVELPDRVRPAITDRDFVIAVIAAPRGGSDEDESVEEQTEGEIANEGAED